MGTTKHCYKQNIKALGGFREEDVFSFSHCKSMGGMVNLDPRGMVGIILMGTTKHCYIQNIEALGLLISENFFLDFPIVSLR